MGNRGAKLAGLEQAPMSVDDSATQIMEQVKYNAYHLLSEVGKSVLLICELRRSNRRPSQPAVADSLIIMAKRCHGSEATARLELIL